MGIGGQFCGIELLCAAVAEIPKIFLQYSIGIMRRNGEEDRIFDADCRVFKPIDCRTSFVTVMVLVFELTFPSSSVTKTATMYCPSFKYLTVYTESPVI